MTLNHTTKDWLVSVLSPYENPRRLERDAVDLLVAYAGLSPKTDYYQSNLLLTIFGVIPITYSSVQYNIPVALWIPLRYPFEGPICFIVPTPGMQLRSSSRWVDAAGRILHPMLSFWKDDMNLTGLIARYSTNHGRIDTHHYAPPDIITNQSFC